MYSETLFYLQFICMLYLLPHAHKEQRMTTTFTPRFTCTPKIANNLLRIEAAKVKLSHVPLSPRTLRSLRETARLYTTHYSTMIEGNRLTIDEIESVLKQDAHFPGYERDEQEVKGYYAALMQIEQWVARGTPLTKNMLQTTHALVMSDGKTKVKPTPWRDGQNVIKDGRTKRIVYMPPEAKDVDPLMKALITWIKTTDLACPIVAGIAHYQYATIHPYYDGNGRSARLLTTFVLHAGGYSLKGLYSLEEYYARNLGAYYKAISVGDSHNYYMGRADADITPWIAYFTEGMAIACENVLKHMALEDEQGSIDQTELMYKLDPKQRKAVELFQEFETITSSQIGQLFDFKPRTSAALCAAWVKTGFLEIVDPSNKGRKYTLAKKYQDLLGRKK